jgi:hypothetical protein
MRWEPSDDATNVTYTFVVKDAAGVEKEVKLNTDGTIVAGGALELASVVLPLADDPTREKLKIQFQIDDLYLSENRRSVVIEGDNISGDAGSALSAIQYLFKTRKDDGGEGSVVIYPDGSVASTGNGTFQRAYVGTQGAPDTLAPNELITKGYFDQNGGGGVASTAYFSEVLYNSVAGLIGGTFTLANPLLTVGPPQVTHYQQVIVEALINSAQGGGAWDVLVLDVATLRLSTAYSLTSTDDDNAGTIQIKFPTYDSFTVLNAFDQARIHRVIGVSYQGDPFP